MTRIGSLLQLLTGLSLALGPVTAQEKPVAALIVTSSDYKPYARTAAAIARGYQDGKTRTVTLKGLTGGQTKTLLHDGLRVVFAVGTPASCWLSRHKPKNVPLVYCMVADPELAGLTGKTGVHGIRGQPSVNDQFKHIARALPQLKTVGLLYDSRTAKGRTTLARAKKACPRGCTLRAIDVAKHRTLAKAIDKLLKRRVDIVWTTPDSSIYNRASLKALLLKCLRKGVPIYGFSAALVKSGALLGYRVDPADQGRQCARLAKRVLANGKVPIHQHPEHAVALNLSIAHKLGLRLPKRVVNASIVVKRR